MKHYTKITDQNGKSMLQIRPESAEIVIEVLAEAATLHGFECRSLISTALERAGKCTINGTMSDLQSDDPMVQLHALMAFQIGKVAKAYAGTIKAGMAKSKKKSAASRENGKKGGRPKKKK